jgi:hypothetical protein
MVERWVLNQPLHFSPGLGLRQDGCPGGQRRQVEPGAGGTSINQRQRGGGGGSGKQCYRDLGGTGHRPVPGDLLRANSRGLEGLGEEMER